jgi:hypothetical protein
MRVIYGAVPSQCHADTAPSAYTAVCVVGEAYVLFRYRLGHTSSRRLQRKNMYQLRMPVCGHVCLPACMRVHAHTGASAYLVSVVHGVRIGIEFTTRCKPTWKNHHGAKIR